MLMRRSPAAARSSAIRPRVAPLVVMARSTPRAASLLDQDRQAGPDRRLATGQADRVEVEALDQDPGDALDLLEGEDLVPGHPVHALLGHAVDAAEVAAVGDRDAQVAVHATERVDQRRPHDSTLRGRAGGGIRGSARGRDLAEGDDRRASSPCGHAVAVGDHGQGVGRGHGAAGGGCPGRRPGRRGTPRRGRTPRPGRSGSCRRAGARRRRRPRPGPGCGRAGDGPSSSAGPGRAKSSKDTSDDTGLPGRPNTGVPSTRPKANGLAGRMAICIQRMSPRVSSTCFTRSKSPTLTPPRGDDGVAGGGGLGDGRGDEGLVVGHGAEVDGLEAAGGHLGQQHRPVGVPDLAEGQRRPGR